MATIDDKVVSMSFESSKFESGVHSTIGAIDKLKASLNFSGAGKGLQEFDSASKKIDLSHIAKGVDTISEKLNALRLAAIAVFAQIATQAVRAGANLIKAFTLDPIMAGFKEYSTNLNAIQTVLSNTKVAGTSLKDVNAALLELNKYSDKTIYNFGQMAKNIGTFTAAGVDLKTSTAAIKGIANLAALSGSNADQASTAMYQLSQALAAGSLKLMDWNSVVNAGMGGAVFQRALAQTGEAMGTIKKGAVELSGPMKTVTISGKAFRNSLSIPGKDSWLTSDVLTATLKQFTGDMTDAQLKTMGFTEAQIKSIQQMGKTAMFAATEVKTIAQVLDVAKETAGSGWSQTFQIVMGDFGEAKTTFTALSTAINGMINKSADARNKVLADWKALGGRTALIDGIKTAFQSLGAILAPIKDAFRDIFPAKTGQDLFNATKKFQEFAAALKPSAETVENLHRTFAGLFAALDIGWQIIKGVGTVFVELFKAAGGGSGGFLSLTAAIGDFFVAIDKALKKGDALHNFFEGLGKVLGAPLALLSKFAGVLGDLFSGFSAKGISAEMNGLSNAMSPLEAVVSGISKAWDKFTKSLENAVDMQSILESIGTGISGIGVALGHMFANMNFEVILQFIRTGLFAALVVMFKEFLGPGSILNQITKGFGSGILSNISGIFSGLNGSMQAFQQNLKAKTLKEIAIAIALLAASVLLLSLVDPEKLSGALGAMTIMFGELIGAMALLNKVATGPGFLKLPIITASLIGLAVAIDLLTISVMAMSMLSWSELIKGLTGVGALLAGVALVSGPLSANSAGLIRASVGMIALGVALNILALAVRQFGSMSLAELGKGLGGVAVGLGVIAVAAQALPLNMAITGAGLIIVATGLMILANAVLKFGSMDWSTMGKGLAGVAGSLVIIAGAMQLMPLSMVVTAAGLVLVALSLGKIADAVMKMGGMSIREIAKGLGTLAGSLVILAVALTAMSGTLAGAAALTVAASGIALLAPALVMLGQQKWSTILKGMVTLAGALAILGVAGLAIGPVAPALLALGVAMVLLGGGLALAGAGIFLIASGLSIIAVAGPAAIGILIAALNEFLEAIPKLATNFALGLLSVVEAFAKTAPQFVAALVKIIDQLLDVIIKASPKIAEAFIALLDAALTVLRERQSEIIAAGMSLIIALLTGIKNNIGQIVTVVADIIVKLLTGISSNLGRIIAAGAEILVSLLKGIANGIANVATAALDIITKFIGAITSGLGQIATAGIGILTKLLTGIAKNISNVIDAATDIIVAFVKGIGEAGVRLVKAGADAATKFVNALATEIPKLAQNVFDAVIKLINGMAAVIGSEENAAKMRSAGMNLGWAIINGMTLGLAGKAQEVYNKAKEIADKVASYLHLPFSINSPSKLTQGLGASIVEGLTLGLSANAESAYTAAIALSNGVINAFNATFQTASPSKVMIQIGSYVGRGFAEGLRGSGEDINNAFADLNEKLTTAMVKARETILSEQKKLDELRKASKPDAEAIATAQKAIAESEILLKNSTATRLALMTTLKDEQNQLVSLSGQYDKVSEKIKAATDAVKTAKKELLDLQNSLTAQYSTGPALVDTDMTSIVSARTALTAEQEKLNQLNATNAATAEELQAQQLKVNEANNAYNLAVAGRVLTQNGTAVDQLASYMEALKNQTAAVGAYDSTLKQLRQLGLDDVTYTRLLTEGTADQSFANQLLAGGRTAVQALNVLDGNLMKVSKNLATSAAKNLKQAGVDGAEGLLAGLTSKNAKIREAMDNIIDDIIGIIKSKMKIKSPSKVFEEMGGFAMQGLANGFTKSSNVVTDAVKQTAKDALSKMRESLSKLLKFAMDDLNLSPIIRPILDLTQMQNQAKGFMDQNGTIRGLIANASYGQASNIARNIDDGVPDSTNSTTTGPSVKFEQNNYSPTALTEIEIYRQTKNQLSQLKSVLVIN